MSEQKRLPGGRDVRASLDGGDAETLVVACPPHPQMGGDRRDSRLRAVSDTLRERGVACLRIDYGSWDGGEDEQTDVGTALAWAREDFETVGLFGYSFGAGVALLAAAAAFDAGAGDSSPAAMAVLAPPESIGDTHDVTAAVDSVACPLQVVYGERDDTVDSAPVAERAREQGHAVERVPADHFFVGQQSKVAATVADFLAARLGGATAE